MIARPPGDKGRAAQQFGVKGAGIDIDPARIAEANANARNANVTHLVSFKQADLFTSDFSDATVTPATENPVCVMGS